MVQEAVPLGPIPGMQLFDPVGHPVQLGGLPVTWRHSNPVPLGFEVQRHSIAPLKPQLDVNGAHVAHTPPVPNALAQSLRPSELSRRNQGIGLGRVTPPDPEDLRLAERAVLEQRHDDCAVSHLMPSMLTAFFPAR